MHTNDLKLTQEDIGQLENIEQIIHFFAQLGYDVDDAISLDHASLGMDTEDLRQQIRQLHRVASDPDEELIIYFLRVHSVTTALTQTVARRFRDRTEDTLLVLTKDFETLDFVLLDKELAKGTARGKALRQIIRPRSLTVNRRNPDPVALRVLKRFTFTEADGIYQWEKLRAAYGAAEWAEPEFNNRALFSDYYLKNRLTDTQLTPQWKEDVRPIGRRVHQFLSQARQTYSRQKEQVIRAGLFEPLFRELGFDFTAVKLGDSDSEEPDYNLYAPGEQDKPVALALTYVWNRNLDDEDPVRDQETPNEIPGTLVVSVLENTDVPWVIMTNGKLWRLYSATASNKATNYYEIDLEEALAAPDQLIALKYWWLFFRQQAFTGFLDDLLRQSADFAKGLGDRLKDRVFTEIFPHFAAGFIHDIRAQSGRPQAKFSDESLQWVYEGTLTFLYRLMFVLYAESLELLPLAETHGYFASSLYQMKQEIARKAGTILDEAAENLKKGYTTISTDLYDRLAALFTFIDTGSEALNLPTYNGGLFSRGNDNGEFLADYKIPDRHLALGLDRLCRDVDEKSQALVFVDYKSLGVRHLGSIYEGLLEFKLRIAQEELAVIKEKGKEVFIPAAKAKNKRVQTTIPRNAVYLENDKKERKATGSYYTPDYIVKYIVAHTVGPVLERKFADLTPRLREAQKAYRDHVKKVRARGNDQPVELFWHAPKMRQLADDCLNVRVLDPAMGSGHFLVEAVDFVSNRLIDFLNGWTDNPVWALLERTRDDIAQDMERQKVTIDAARLTRVALLKRAVLKRCVYGVDLNLMAVELAKVSLWLDAFTLGAPLSFLDHHLKQGNSLIGARVRDVRDALQAKPGQQMSLLAQSKFTGMMLATDLMRQVSFLSDNTVSQVAESRQAYRSARDHLAPYKRVLDVYTSRWFGNAPSKKGFEPVIEFLQRDDTQAWIEDPANARLPQKDYMNVRQVAETALQAAAEKSFFHWELEFPEIFFAPSTPGGQDVELLKDGGFDAVVGNPPYQRIQTIQQSSPEQASYYESNFQSATGKYDIYVLFIEKLSSILQGNGLAGAILPHKFIQAHFGQGIREYLHKTGLLHKLFSFGTNQVFAQATTYTCLLFLGQASNSYWNYCELPDIRSDSKLMEQFLTSITNDYVTKFLKAEFSSSPWILGERRDAVILEKIRQSSFLLKEISDGIYQGIVTGLNDAYILEQVDESPNSLNLATLYSPLIDKQVTLEIELLRPFVKGEGVARYGDIKSTHWIVYPYRTTENGPKLIGEDELKTSFPKTFSYLNENKAVLSDRGSKNMKYPSWYSLWNPRNLNNFNRQKIMIPDVSLFGSMTISLDSNLLHADTLYALIINSAISYNLYTLLAILNSNLMWFFLQKSGTPLRGGYYRYKSTYLEQFPIQKIVFNTPADQRSQLVEQIISAYANWDKGEVLAQSGAALTAAQTDVIHDVLAHLAQMMIDLNKQKQAEVRRFLGWLEGQLKITPKDGKTGLDVFTGKTILQGYLGDYQKGDPELPWDDFQYRLHQNRSRFKANLAQIKGQIQAEYEQSLAVLLPIKQQLAATDALIDQIVYQLYGLSDEEIELIERPAYEQALTDAKEAVLKDKKLQKDPDAAAEAIAAGILPAAQRLHSRVNTTPEEAALSQDLPGWHLFTGDVPTFLLTGEYNIAHLPDQLDFSTSIIGYTKAVEQAIMQRIFEPFRAAGYTAADCKNVVLQGFMAGKKKLTLGSFPFIFTSQEKALRAFADRQYPGRGQALFFDKTTGVRALLNDQASIDLRNKAAHAELLTKEDARSGRDWALAILKFL